MSIGSVLIRFIHPEKDLSFLSSMLGLSCTRTWVAGTPRQTPKGTPLSGVYKESYWTSCLDFNNNKDFLKKLLIAVNKLEKARETVFDIKSTGGSIEIYYQLSGKVNSGITIDSTVLYKLGEMGVDLLVEIFPDYSS